MIYIKLILGLVGFSFPSLPRFFEEQSLEGLSLLQFEHVSVGSNSFKKML